jgi:serine/threonine-protein kinase
LQAQRGLVETIDDKNHEDFDLAFCQEAIKKRYLSKKLFKECFLIYSEVIRLGLTKPTVREIVLSRADMKPEQVTEVMALLGARSGKRTIEGYKLLEKMASGAFGSIYRAKQTSMNRTVALKVLPRRLALNEIYVKNFMRETKLAAQLTHENIVYVLDAGQSAGLLYIAMEFIEGESLHSVVQRSGPMDEKQALAVTWSLAQALSHAHKTGILHRDVKPANVMMQDGKVPKLCDFGMAKSIARSAMMEVSAIMGTPSYMSPEQILGERPDERTDIYGLGATLYTMATGKLPFPEVQTYQELYDCHIRRSVTTLRDANPMVSAKIEWIVLKMMKRKREKRFQSADEVSDAFLEIARRN